MSLGMRNMQVSARQLVKVDYDQWLNEERGEVITGVTVTVIPVSTPATAATVDSVQVTPDREAVMFVVGGPTIVGDQFSLEITINTSLTQTRSDIIGVTIVAIS